ncbi:hypothetical protein DV735_g2794, partial [Chaetothyriales sp. CBS 134920]
MAGLAPPAANQWLWAPAIVSTLTGAFDKIKAPGPIRGRAPESDIKHGRRGDISERGVDATVGLSRQYSSPRARGQEADGSTGLRLLPRLGQDLERRLMLVEKALTEKLLAKGPAEREAVKSDAFGEFHFPIQHVGQWVGMVNSYNGFPFFSSEGQEWVQECTGQRIRFPSMTTPNEPAQTPGPSPEAAIELSTALPDKPILLDQAALWKISFMWQIFPVFTYSQLDQTIQTAYSEDIVDGSLESLATRCSLHAFLAFTTVFGLSSPLGPPIDAPACARTAKHLLVQLMWMPPTVETVQAVFMLAFFEAVRGEMPSMDMFMAIGVRILFLLGAHKYQGSDVEESNNLRNLFWLFYVMDKDMSIWTGRPPFIADDQCDLTLPPDQDHRLESRLGSMRLRLSMIKSRAFNSLYSVHGLQKSDAELLRAIIELDDELEQWRISLPPAWRPPLAFSQSKPGEPAPSDIGPREVPIMLTRLEYLRCAAIIHQASSRCRVWDSAGQPVKGVRSSSDLSVAASRSTLQYIIHISDGLKGHAFWYILLYTTSAVLTLFCNILSYPLSASARQDISFLEIAPAVLHYGRSLSNDVLSPNEEVRLRTVTNFLEDLARLAPLAITKARAEAS